MTPNDYDIIQQQDDYEEPEHLPAEGDRRGLLEQVNTLTAQINTGMSMVQNVAQLYNESKIVEAKADAIQAWSTATIAKTAAKFKACEDFMLHTFGERDKALSKHYELIDHGIASGNMELIVEALRGISGIVTKSPLQDLEEFAKVFEDDSIPLFDF